jgi:hypothetical protein
MLQIGKWPFRMILIAVALLGTSAVGSCSDADDPTKFRTKNFEVKAPTAEVARKVAEAAERHRKELANRWLGREMPTWPAPCPLRVTVQAEGAGGATTFVYGPDGVERQEMHIEGRYDRLLKGVLPHEITHTVFAHYFRCAMPRWADEGGAVLSEDEAEIQRHAKLMRDVLGTARFIPVERLLKLKEYPDDVMALYVEGYSLTRFLVERKDRKTFLAFVAQGMNNDWAQAAQEHYEFNDLEELERKWTEAVKNEAKKDPVARIGLPEKVFGPDFGGTKADTKGLVLEVIVVKPRRLMDEKPARPSPKPDRLTPPSLGQK